MSRRAAHRIRLIAGAFALAVLVALAVVSWSPPGTLDPQNLGVAQAAPDLSSPDPLDASPAVQDAADAGLASTETPAP